MDNDVDVQNMWTKLPQYGCAKTGEGARSTLSEWVLNGG